MGPLMRTFALHKREFTLQDDPFLDLFEDLIRTNRFCILECSPVITPVGIHAARFRAGGFKPHLQEGLPAILDFLDKIERCDDVRLGRELLEEIISERSIISRVTAFGMGIDIKEKTVDSKVKCYFLVEDEVDRLLDIFSSHGAIEDTIRYLISDTFLFAVDMYFDGKRAVETYCSFEGQDLKERRLTDRLNFSNRVLNLIEQCRAITVSFGHGTTRVLHFHPKSPTRFIRSMNNRPLSLLYSRVQIIEMLLSRSKRGGPIEVSVALPEEELSRNGVQNVGLYYRIENKT